MSLVERAIESDYCGASRRSSALHELSAHPQSRAGPGHLSEGGSMGDLESLNGAFDAPPEVTEVKGFYTNMLNVERNTPRSSISSSCRNSSSIGDLSAFSANSCDDAGTQSSQSVAIGPTGDALLRTSPFLQDLLDRVVRLELAQDGQKSLASRVQTISTHIECLRQDIDNVSREHRHNAMTMQNNESAIAEQNLVNQLSRQVASLNFSVAQLLAEPRPTFSPSTSTSTRSCSPIDRLRKPSASMHLSPALVDLPPSSRSSAPMSPVTVVSGDQPSSTSPTGVTWEAIGVSPQLARAAAACGFGDAPSRIQASAVGHVLRDADLVVQAPLMRDRLASFIVPSITFLHSTAPVDSIQIIVVSASIEQASQCHRWFSHFGARAAISASNIDLTAELANLQTRPPDVLIGTPQRLLDLFSLRALPLGALRMLVVDEADNLVARNLADFVLSLVRILPASARPSGRQTVILAAIVPQEVLVFASSLRLREPVRVLVKRETAVAGGDSAPSVRGIRHHFLWIAMAAKGMQAEAWKLEAVADLFEDIDFRQAVVWCALLSGCQLSMRPVQMECTGSTDETVKAVAQRLASRGIEAHPLHDEFDDTVRTAVLSQFKPTSPERPTGGKQVLVLPESLARSGTTVPQVPLVVNFDLPDDVETYVQRVSCSAATGYARPGVAVNVVTNDREVMQIRKIEAFYRIQVAEVPPSLKSLL